MLEKRIAKVTIKPNKRGIKEMWCEYDYYRMQRKYFPDLKIEDLIVYEEKINE